MIRKAVIAVSLVFGVIVLGLLWVGNLGSDTEHLVWSAAVLAAVVSVGTLVLISFEDPSERRHRGLHKASRTRRVLKCCSLIVCLLLIATWLVNVRWGVSYSGARWEIFCTGGVVLVVVRPPLPWPSDGMSAGRRVGEMEWWGFGNYWTARVKGVAVPVWFLLLLFAAYPTLAFIRGPVRRWRRRRKGLCVKCGYNLTGLPEPRCPECGESI